MRAKWNDVTDDRRPVFRRRAVFFAAISILSQAASATSIPLNGSGTLNWTAQFLGNSGGNTQTTPGAPYGNSYSLSLPGQYSFSDTFSSPQTSPLVDSSNVPFEQSGSPVGEYSFQDTYAFSLSAPAVGDALVVSLDLGAGSGNLFDIANLQFRLYEVPSSSTIPGLTIPAGSTNVYNWTGKSGNDLGTVISTTFSNATSGTYFLDIAGTADGTSGGTYVGQLNLAPVPVGPALPMLVSGLAGLGFFARRRRATLGKEAAAGECDQGGRDVSAIRGSLPPP